MSLTPHPSWPWAVIVDSEGGTSTPGNAAPQVTIDTGATVIADLTATLAWSATDADGDPLTYSVAWGDGQTTSNATSPESHTYAAAGEYTATVTASDGVAAGSAQHAFTAVDPAAGTSPYHDAVMADGPLLYYPLSQAAPPVLDVTGTTTATSADWPDLGVVGIGDGDTCAQFVHNTSDQVQTSASAELNGLSAFTLECLMQPNDNSGNTRTMICRDDQIANKRAFRLYRSGRKFGFSTRGTGSATVTTTQDYPAGSVYHLAAVFTGGSTVAIYVNGVKDGEATISMASSPTLVDIPLMIGNRTGTPDSAYCAVGLLAGVAVYDKALTPARIEAHKTAAGIPA